VQNLAMAQPPHGHDPNDPRSMSAYPPQPPGAGVLDALVPTNPLAAVACWTGIFSVKRGTVVQQSNYGKATSTARSWIGIVSGVIGTIVSLVVIVVRLTGRH